MRNYWYLILLASLMLSGITRASLFCWMLALAMTVALLISGISTFLVRSKLSFEMTAPEICEKNRDYQLRVTGKNSRRLPVGLVSCLLETENSVTGEVKRTRILLTGQPIIQRSPYCGCITCRLKDLRVHDWFNVLQISCPQSYEAKVLVMPDTFPVQASLPQSTRAFRDTEEYSAWQKGQDRTETFQIRDYVPGDPLSTIHWKLSGKLGQLIVRDPSLPVDHSLVLVWNRHARGQNAENEDALFEAFSSVALSYSQQGIPYSFVWKDQVTEICHVSTEEKFPEAIARLLKSAPVTDGDGAEEAGLLSSEYLKYGSVLFFSDQLSAMLLDACREQNENRNMTLFFCGEEATSIEEDASVYCFQAGTMEEVLSQF